MFNFKTLINRQADQLKVLEAVFPELSNIFNPSLLVKDGMIHIAFRAIQHPGGAIEAFYVVLYAETGVVSFKSNLTESYSKFGLNKVADPKLFVFNDVVHMTFNSGYSRTQNSIYISNVEQLEESPKELVFANRMGVEKNWAFFSMNENLYAIYSLNPLVVLKCSNSMAGDELVFEEIFRAFVDGIPDLTIGSQLACLEENKFILIGHMKTKIRKKRIYWGVPLIFKVTNEGFSLVQSPKKLIHSTKSLWGNKVKHNKNLFSCTYFSGISHSGNELLLSYGINDLDYGIAKTTMRALWN